MKKNHLVLGMIMAASASVTTAAPASLPDQKSSGWVGVFGEYYNPDNQKPEPIGYLEDGKGLGIEAGWRFDEKWAARAEFAQDYLGRKKSRLGGVDAEDSGHRFGADILYFLNQDDLYVFTGVKHQNLEGQRTLLDVGVGKHWQLSERWKAITEGALYQDVDESLIDFGLKIGLAYEFGFTQSKSKRVSTPTAPVVKSAVDEVIDEVIDDVIEEVNELDNGATDTDGDGVVDRLDQCAVTPTTDKVDESGCSVLTEKEVSISLNVNFANNSAKVTNPNDAQFVDFAAFMSRYSNSQAAIEGHSSAGGAASYNLRLSQQRADSVRQLLIKQYGIDSTRLTSEGFGETRLLDKSNTAEAAKRNRRIEVKVTAKQVTVDKK